jgi:caa(3)-type oxidase subunit IV
MKTLIQVYLGLLLLLALTVWVSLTPLPYGLSTAFALLIAGAKASLVLVFFMNLNIAHPKIRFFAFATLLWTVALISLIAVDYLTRGSHGVLGK